MHHVEPKSILGLWVGVVIYQDVDGLDVALERGEVQRCELVIVRARVYPLSDLVLRGPLEFLY